jgi:hypothetical protein
MMRALSMQEVQASPSPCAAVVRLQPTPRFTGAAILGNTLVIATVERRHGRLWLVPSSSGRFSLDDRCQTRIRELHGLLHKFLRDRAIERVLLRFAPQNGKFRAHPFTYLVETVLHLVPDVRVQLVHPSTIAAWARRFEEELPLPPPCETKRVSGYFEKAIEIACLAQDEGLPSGVD